MLNGAMIDIGPIAPQTIRSSPTTDHAGLAGLPTAKLTVTDVPRRLLHGAGSPAALPNEGRGPIPACSLMAVSITYSGSKILFTAHGNLITTCPVECVTLCAGLGLLTGRNE